MVEQKIIDAIGVYTEFEETDGFDFEQNQKNFMVKDVVL